MAVPKQGLCIKSGKNDPGMRLYFVSVRLNTQLYLLVDSRESKSESPSAKTMVDLSMYVMYHNTRKMQNSESERTG